MTVANVMNIVKEMRNQIQQMNRGELKELIKGFEDMYSNFENDNSLKFIQKLNCKFSKIVFLDYAKDIYRKKYGELG